jgi:hypothetical protein
MYVLASVFVRERKESGRVNLRLRPSIPIVKCVKQGKLEWARIQEASDGADTCL